ncbi:MAG: FAD-dependent oxidoreductase [Betaproteobacteria bacterium]
MNATCDAIIIGGGPAGACAATLLARAGWQVVLVEKARFPRQKVCGEFISATTWPLLRDLGAEPLLANAAGPPVRRVAVFAGRAQLMAPIALPDDAAVDGGSAIGRDMLDTALLQQARAAGADVRQPARLDAVSRTGDGYACRIEDGAQKEGEQGPRYTLRAPILIAAHGSWESGPLPTQPLRARPRASNLLAFKARFAGGALPRDLMPLIAFPGGYGGMVHTNGGLVSLSCCIRRDALAACREARPRERAGAAVLAHIMRHCAGVAAALREATPESAWLAAGPIRPGMHGFGRDGVFAIGNAAAEAHPIVAEGISMAIQSAALLCEQLLMHPRPVTASWAPSMLAAVHRSYAEAWRSNFARRLHASSLYAHLFMRPPGARAAVAMLENFPSLLTLGSRWSGKAAPLRAQRFEMAGTNER